MRTTRKELDALADLVNRELGAPRDPIENAGEPGSRWVPGCYFIEHRFKGCALACVSNEQGATSDVTVLDAAGGTARQIRMLLEGIRLCKRANGLT
jgi:hypothetical protein